MHAVFVWEAKSGRTRAVTDGLADARFPVFDAGGKYLWFTASTDWGPTAPWLDMTSVEHPVTRSLWLAILPAGEPSPFAPESDEEKGKESGAKDDGKGDADAGKKENGKKDAGKGEADDVTPPEVRIDFDGLATTFVMTGGYIKNAIVRAAVIAAREERALTSDDLWSGAHNEYAEMGKVMPMRSGL